MFGKRPDGKRIDNIDPIIRFTPYIMPTRVDSTNSIKLTIDYAPMANYIRKKRLEGKNISFMDLIIAAYVRCVAEYPFLNRFIANKQVFARNEISVSFVTLKVNEDKNKHDEALVKLKFKPDATIDEVSEIVEHAIKEARKPESPDKTLDFAMNLLKIPGMANFIVFVAKLLDRYGIMPKMIHDVSPFHCSMFITNMASIGLPALMHHIYNFGTCSQFFSLGSFEKAPIPTSTGFTFKNVVPIGVVSDERICGGADYAVTFSYIKKLLSDPTVLEKRPEKINYDIKFPEK